MDQVKFVENSLLLGAFLNTLSQMVTYTENKQQGFNPILFSKVPWLSLTLARSKLQGSHIFPSLNSKSFKEKIYIMSRRFYSWYMFIIIRLHFQMNVLQLYTKLDEHNWKHWLTQQSADIFNKNCMAIKNC